MKKLIILFLIVNLFVWCSDSRYVRTHRSEDIKFDVINITIYEVKDGFLISFGGDSLSSPKTMSQILNKFKISALDVISFSPKIILVKKTTELENKINEYLKESENK